ncbi:MAG: aspartate-semialdehyde dehydrogenase [Deltaproteobacteria bacterium]|nr:aspartate-semialdehyde dehydrogenase [Deltaproteobacteria bacterium]
MDKEKYNIAVVGATGMVGKEILSILEERKFPVGEVRLLASERSAGEKIRFKGKDIVVRELSKEDFKGIDIGLFSPGGSVSKVHAPRAAEAGCVVIDNTSFFRMDEEVPLVVPEVNPEAIGEYSNKNIIANPNCSTIQMVVALKPIHDNFTIKRVVVSTYQSVSGAGKAAIDELSAQVQDLFNMREVKPKVFNEPIAFNCIPQIDVFTESGDTKEEVKMVNETKKILGDDSVKLTATAVRVPVFLSHSEAINIETLHPVSPSSIREVLKDAPGIILTDNPAENTYPTALNASGTDGVYVGRIRTDETVEHGINMWIVSDNIRKGAALNAVQIAELLIRDYI